MLLGRIYFAKPCGGEGGVNDSFTILFSKLFFKGSKVLQNDEFTKDLFRFLQLLCEGHNGGEVPLCSINWELFPDER